MRSKLQWASMIAVAAMVTTVSLGASESGAAAQENEPAIVQTESAVKFVSEPVVQDVPGEATDVAEDEDTSGADTDLTSEAPETEASSLAEMVMDQPQPAKLSRELNCLAGAIYFEARGESLPGQLAVGRVIVARAKSSRFPDSYCGVVFQPYQFSFVRNHGMPAIRKHTKAWRRAVAIALIADHGSWESPVEGALFFHATYVAPRWGLTRIARVDNHIFYR